MKLGKRRLNPIKKNHFVPLSRQALVLLDELRGLTGGGKYLFPNLRDHSRPMSNNAFLKALERMGYKGDMSGHGFRALAMSTIKERLGYRHEVVDRRLAHVQKDKIARAYDRAEFIDERREMMQAWADYLDSLAVESSLGVGARQGVERRQQVLLVESFLEDALDDVETGRAVVIRTRAGRFQPDGAVFLL